MIAIPIVLGNRIRLMVDSSTIMLAIGILAGKRWPHDRSKTHEEVKLVGGLA